MTPTTMAMPRFSAPIRSTRIFRISASEGRLESTGACAYASVAAKTAPKANTRELTDDARMLRVRRISTNLDRLAMQIGERGDHPSAPGLASPDLRCVTRVVIR